MEKNESFLIKLNTVGATWFGLGKISFAPGTMGTIGAIPLLWLASSLPPITYMIFVFSFTVLAIVVSHIHEIATNSHDNSEIVIDEVVGFLVTMTWVPFTWSYVLMGFVLFRILDILKPFPISYVDRKIKGGVGVVSDDLLAGIIANVLMQVLIQQGLL